MSQWKKKKPQQLVLWPSGLVPGLLVVVLAKSQVSRFQSSLKAPSIFVIQTLLTCDFLGAFLCTVCLSASLNIGLGNWSSAMSLRPPPFQIEETEVHRLLAAFSWLFCCQNWSTSLTPGPGYSITSICIASCQKRAILLHTWITTFEFKFASWF